MKTFLIDSAVMMSLFIPVFLVTFSVLWKLRSKGAYTLLLGLAFEVVFIFLGFAVAPKAMQYHHGLGGPSPVEEGIMMGICMPMVFMFLYYMGQWKKQKQDKKAALPT